MHSHTPQDRRAFEHPEPTPAEPARPSRSTVLPIVIAGLALAVIVVLILLL